VGSGSYCMTFVAFGKAFSSFSCFAPGSGSESSFTTSFAIFNYLCCSYLQLHIILLSLRLFDFCILNKKHHNLPHHFDHTVICHNFHISCYSACSYFFASLFG